MTTIAIEPAAPVAVLSACRVDVTGAPVSDTGAYNVALYPTSPEIRYYLSFEKAGADTGKRCLMTVRTPTSLSLSPNS
jgi:hypothetical protein